MIAIVTHAQYILEDFAPKVQSLPKTYQHIVQQDGKVVMAGDYDFNGIEQTKHIVRLQADGSLDESFQLSDSIPDVQVWKMIDGHHGDFAIISTGDTFTGYIIRQDGSIRATITAPEGASSLLEIKKYLDGYVAIFHAGINRAIYRLDSAGNLHTAFTPFFFEGFFEDFQIDQKERMVLVGDNFSQLTGLDEDTRVLRIDSLGVVDTSLGTVHLKGNNLRLFSLPESKFIVSGSLDSLNYEKLTQKTIMVDEDWSMVTSFDATFLSEVYTFGIITSAHYVEDDLMLVRGNNVNVAQGSIRGIKMDGSFNVDFAPIQVSGNGGFDRISVKNENAYYSQINPNIHQDQHYPIMKFDLIGTWDVEYSSATRLFTSGIVLDVTVDHLGGIIFGGEFASVNNVVANSLARFHENTVDAAFSEKHGLLRGSTITKIETTASNDIFIGGNLAWQDTDHYSLAKLHSDGSVDDSFSLVLSTRKIGPGLDDFEQMEDGRILVAGAFDFAGNGEISEFEMLDFNGNLIESFQVNEDSLGLIAGYNVSVYNDEIILSGLKFSTTNSSAGQRGFLWFVDENGAFISERGSTSELMFLPETSEIIHDRLLLGGRQFSAGESTPNPVYQLDLQTNEVDETSIATQGGLGFRGGNRHFLEINDSTFVVAGRFDRINDSESFGFAGINSSGVVNERLNFAFSKNNEMNFVNGTAKLNESTIVVAGRFDRVNDMAASGLIQLSIRNYPTMVELPESFEFKEDTTFHINDLITVVDLDDNVKIQAVANDHLTIDDDGLAMLEENYNGTIELGFLYEINNEVSDTLFTTLEILPVNDAPEFISQITVPVIEPGQQYVIRLEDLEYVDPDEGDVLSFEIEETENYTLVDTNTIETNASFEGTINVRMRLSDGELFSEYFDFELISAIVLSIDQSKFSFYPNPTANLLHIEGLNEQGYKVSVFDGTGRKIKGLRITMSANGSLTIDFRNLKPGIFMIQTSQNGQTKTFRILKK